ncbi:uncharacterized protein FOMMEDRAFT_139174 [Fomitiporia mediterranea MF3/22]|uniref:uncharacterized protein n=1 Tax=Fomitiporia mediterranea (strain MF3/22) TaxID=694068 RepID=UPI0004408B70|nr:uncharacterized protein FOMMEDRAFT_139174 [Fomitiporia mediterranea MF3/22]EJD05841.1 hypothetical protein FOMMEDRAFT_139174 [Fomitiporia mediterranea MF3/22]
MTSSTTGLWDPVRVKTQLRLTAQRLGQLQDKKDSLAHITSRDIATLLGRRNVSLARAKAQNLMKEDAVSNAMEVLEMYCGVVLERFAELEKDELHLHPPTIEAVASIIYAAAFTESQDLCLMRDMLTERLGSDFAQSALHNSDGHVSHRILRIMHWTPSAQDIDSYLQNIAQKFGVDWTPPMQTDEKLSILSAMLDASDIMGTIDLATLRAVASSGLPSNPSWLRPRVWKLLLGTTPSLKVQWELDSQKKREDYYDLIRRLLGKVASLPPPTTPPSDSDKSLVSLVESLARVPAHLFRGLEDELEHTLSCLIHESASEDTKVDCASSLDVRLHLILDQSSTDEDKNSSFDSTPEIRLESGSAPTSPQESSFDLSKAAQGGTENTSKTLSLSAALAPRAFRNVPAHPSHVSALLRLLFIHKSLNPVAESPHLASLLVPLYGVMNQEAEPSELAHAEADTFWLFEALIREVSELEETEGGLVWMKKFRERVAMVDNELLEDLTLKGLDPALPQYSYRWLAPILSHTLPLPAVLTAWDVIFAQPELSRQSNPKLEHLLDICTAMLVRARARLLLLGKGGRKSPSLWDIEPSSIERQTLRPWELGNAFMEGMTLLQDYPIEAAGGMERVLQVARDILTQREQLTKSPQTQNSGFGARIRDRVWKGITNQNIEEDNSPEDSEEESQDETETESDHPQAPSMSRASSTASAWSSYFKTTVMRGITNESAMDTSPNSSPVPSPEPSPSRPVYDLSSPPRLSARTSERSSSSLLSPPSSSSSLWSYAEKLRQSDVAAKLSKARTNLSAKALDAWSTHTAPAHGVPTFDKQREESVAGMEIGRKMSDHAKEGFRHGSVPNIDRSEVYSPPPRPAFFKPPRDTRLFTAEEINSLAIPGSPESSTSSLSTSTLSPGGHNKSESLASVLPSWPALQPKSPKPKSAPKPLLLSASTLVATGSQISRSANSTPTPRDLEWAEAVRSKVQTSPRHRDSQFSQSSMSSRGSNPTASPRGDGKSGWDSDPSVSRIVRLNRQSVSPMAPAFRTSRIASRNPSVSSQSEFGVLNYRTASESSPRSMNGRFHDDEGRSGRSQDRVSPDSPSTLPSSPPPRTPVTNTVQGQTSVRVASTEKQRGSLVLSETGFSTLDPPPQGKKAHRKPSTPTVEAIGDTSDSSIPPVSPVSPLNRTAPRIRTKRFNDTQGITIPRANPSPSSLAAPEFDSELEAATTPRATHFPSTSPTTADGHVRSPRRRKVSMDGPERRRKISGGGSRATRSNKVADGRRDSRPEDGDDEGYDELLSAYESEASKYESASSEA